MTEEIEIVMKWVVGAFIGVLLFMFVTRNRVSYRGLYASTAAPVPQNSFSAVLGANALCVYAPPQQCKYFGLPSPSNDPYPLASDYLPCDTGYAAPTSPVNVGLYCCYYNGAQIAENPDSTNPIGISGPVTTPKPVRIACNISCNPSIPIDVCGTEVV